MTRMHDVSDTHFDLSPWVKRYMDKDGDIYEVFGIDWDCEFGCGRWEMMIIDGTPHIFTECMDTNDDKQFTKALLNALIEKSVIDE